MTPAMCGEAIDVPLRLRPRLPVSRSTDQMLWPGAEMSGFSAEPRRGPRELNVESVSFRAWAKDSPTTSLLSVTSWTRRRRPSAGSSACRRR